MNVQKEARRDAQEFARAQMYYGEGAGTRRKLIAATVDAKASRDPVYGRYFQQEMDAQDMADHASKARRERRRRDVTERVTKSTKAAATGNYQNLPSTLFVIGAVGYVAHKTGFDKIILKKGKEVYADAKSRYEKKKAERRLRNLQDVSYDGGK